ncbi:hypothetical protein [Methylocapsa acidiphila]|uniref:hypothetical protein n=1 Tax=Methylocapsa acidiphila TaxID=133552 RepID=UPI000416D224|nr:hypothetical protein [Methylocapsa acidiphila]
MFEDLKLRGFAAAAVAIAMAGGPAQAIPTAPIGKLVSSQPDGAIAPEQIRAGGRHAGGHRPGGGGWHGGHRPGGGWHGGNGPGGGWHGRPPAARPPVGRPPVGGRPPVAPPPVGRPPVGRPPVVAPPPVGAAWVRPYYWAPGAAIGFVTAATAAAWASAPPQPGLCWYYTDPSRRNGFWDTCPR